MRKILEQEYICDSLKGRIQYFATNYRKSHDQIGRVAIRLDGKEIFKSNWFDWVIKRDEAKKELSASLGKSISYAEFGEQMELGALIKGGFDEFGFYEAFQEYYNQSIENSLTSPDPVVRLFAVLDKRTGKRRLKKLVAGINEQPEWLQPFYKLRFQAEEIKEFD
ncbi:MAG: hypothetical protein FWF08_04275 [Oscillospiraceae bacterium]|nr:hypothetical protein [Oscillospiraceae bacterium]